MLVLIYQYGGDADTEEHHSQEDLSSGHQYLELTVIHREVAETSHDDAGGKLRSSPSSAGFPSWGPWMYFTAIHPPVVETFRSRIRVLRLSPTWWMPPRDPFPGSRTPLHSLINVTLTTLMSAMRPHTWSRRSQSTCTGLNVWALPVIISQMD